VQIRNFIDGQFVAPVGGKYLDNIEPATGKPYSQFPTATVAMSSWPSLRPCAVAGAIARSKVFPPAVRAANQCCSVTP
jgi:aminomuconate-semialdehyde/2-hydroxymuconate-6-semialdehyde dehydrogenase